MNFDEAMKSLQEGKFLEDDTFIYRLKKNGSILEKARKKPGFLFWHQQFFDTKFFSKSNWELVEVVSSDSDNLNELLSVSNYPAVPSACMNQVRKDVKKTIQNIKRRIRSTKSEDSSIHAQFVFDVIDEECGEELSK